MVESGKWRCLGVCPLWGFRLFPAPCLSGSECCMRLPFRLGRQVLILFWVTSTLES